MDVSTILHESPMHATNKENSLTLRNCPHDVSDALNLDLDHLKTMRSIMTEESHKFAEVPFFLGIFSHSLIIGSAELVRLVLKELPSSCDESLRLCLPQRGYMVSLKNRLNKFFESFGQEYRLEGTTDTYHPFDFVIVRWERQIKLDHAIKSGEFETWRALVLDIEKSSARSRKRSTRKCALAIAKIVIFHAWKIFLLMYLLLTTFGVTSVGFYSAKSEIIEFINMVTSNSADEDAKIDFSSIRSADDLYTWFNYTLVDTFFDGKDVENCSTVLVQNLQESTRGSTACKSSLFAKLKDENIWISDRNPSCILETVDGRWILRNTAIQKTVRRRDLLMAEDDTQNLASKWTFSSCYDSDNTLLSRTKAKCINGPYNSMSFFIVGDTIRLRKVRLSALKSKQRCWQFPGMEETEICKPIYSGGGGSKGTIFSFELGDAWKKQWEDTLDARFAAKINALDFNLSSVAKFVPNSDTNWRSNWGKYYPLGGTVLDLHTNPLKMHKQILSSLKDLDFVDVAHGTVAIFVEFSAWIPKAHVVVPVRLSIEFLVHGGIQVSSHAGIFPSLNLIESPTSSQWRLYYGILIALPVTKEIVQFIAEGRHYLRNFWNIIEIFVFAQTIVFLQWFSDTFVVIKATEIKTTGYTDFEPILLHLKWLNWIAGIGMTAMVFQLLETFKTLGDPYGVQIAAIMRTISRDEILGILLLMFGIVLAFAFAQHLSFGNDVKQFESIPDSLQNMLFIMFGDFGDALVQSQRVWPGFATIVFVLFILLIALVVMNILITLVGNTYNAALVAVALERDLSRWHESYKQNMDTHCINPSQQQKTGSVSSIFEYDEVDKRFKYSNLVFDIMGRRRGKDVL